MVSDLPSAMLAEDRQRAILALLQKSGSVRTVTLAERFMVSDQTIRRDFWELEKTGLVGKRHGGAVLLSYLSMPYGERSQLQKPSKIAIAKVAAQLVKDGMTVMIGPGTTTEALAVLLDGRDIKIVTNSLTVAGAVSHPNTKVLLTGGHYRAGSELVTGSWTEQNVLDAFADLCFIGVSGVELTRGYTVTEADEAAVLRQFIRAAKMSVVMSDSTKFQRTAQQLVAPLGAVHYLITDGRLDTSARQTLESERVEVFLARG